MGKITSASAFASGTDTEFHPDTLNYQGSYIGSLMRNNTSVFAAAQIDDYEKSLEIGFPATGGGERPNNFVVDTKKLLKDFDNGNMIEFTEETDESQEVVNVNVNSEKGWVNVSWTTVVNGTQRQYPIASINLGTGAVNPNWFPSLWGRNVKRFYRDQSACEDAETITAFYAVRRDVCGFLMGYSKPRTATKKEVAKLEETGLAAPKGIRIPRRRSSKK